MNGNEKIFRANQFKHYSATTGEDITDFDNRMILIGNGISETEVYAAELDLLPPFSLSEIKQENPQNHVCPKCNENDIIYNNENQVYHCKSCGQEWHRDCYVLVGFPNDTSYFEEENIGYPSFENEDNWARYVQEYEYILHYQKNPNPNTFFVPVKWPESQQYY